MRERQTQKQILDEEIVAPQDFVFGEKDEDKLMLECGREFGPINIRYETFGRLTDNKDNAILILHALSGDAHVSGYYGRDGEKPGWWLNMVGPGKAFDTSKYFIVCSNVLGGCSGSTGPRSIDPNTGKRYNMRFPVITISDMVNAQYRLMKYLGISKWLCLSGGSMGGMQVLQWAVSYPDCVGSIIPIATTSRLSPQGIAFNWVGREAIMRDPAWKNGEYEEIGPEKGLSTARMLAHITYLSDESMQEKFGRNLQDSEKYSYDFEYDFKVESYLKHQGEKFVERFDANSYLYITRAMDYFDLSAAYSGNLSAAFKNFKSPALVVSFTTDWLFPPAQSREIVSALQANLIDVSYCEIDARGGHDSFLLDDKTLSRLVADFLRNRLEEVRNA